MVGCGHLKVFLVVEVVNAFRLSGFAEVVNGCVPARGYCNPRMSGLGFPIDPTSGWL